MPTHQNPKSQPSPKKDLEAQRPQTQLPPKKAQPQPERTQQQRSIRTATNRSAQDSNLGASKTVKPLKKTESKPISNLTHTLATPLANPPPQTVATPLANPPPQTIATPLMNPRPQTESESIANAPLQAMSNLTVAPLSVEANVLLQKAKPLSLQNKRIDREPEDQEQENRYQPNPSSTDERAIKVVIQNETLELLPEKAFFWRKQRLLGLSDVHLGKAESYQAAGVPMPSGAHREDLASIRDLVQKHSPTTVAILGDWIHQKTSWTEEIISDLHNFFEEHSRLHWILILGNHERGSIEHLQKFPIEIIIEELTIGPITLTHGHHDEKQGFSIQGHIHPAVRLKEGSTSVRLPAFVLTKNSLILPAFGSQTGGYELKTTSKDRVFPTTGTSIFELPTRKKP